MHGKLSRPPEKRVRKTLLARISARPKRFSIAHKGACQNAPTVPHVATRRLLRKKLAEHLKFPKVAATKISLSKFAWVIRTLFPAADF